MGKVYSRQTVTIPVEYASERKIREYNKLYYRFNHWPIWIFVFFIAPGPLTFDLFERGFDLRMALWLGAVLLGTGIAGLRGALPGVEPRPYIIRFTEDRPNPLYRRVCYTLAWSEVVTFALLNITGLVVAIVSGYWYLKQIYRFAYFPIAGTIWLLRRTRAVAAGESVNQRGGARAPLLLWIRVGGLLGPAGSVAGYGKLCADSRRQSFQAGRFHCDSRVRGQPRPPRPAAPNPPNRPRRTRRFGLIPQACPLGTDQGTVPGPVPEPVPEPVPGPGPEPVPGLAPSLAAGLSPGLSPGLALVTGANRLVVLLGMRTKRFDGWLAAAVIAHLLISALHGRAHDGGHVALTAGQSLFVYTVILAGPLVGLAVSFIRARVGGFIVAATMPPRCCSDSSITSSLPVPTTCRRSTLNGACCSPSPPIC
jgi:hypothetical protein